MRDAKIGPSIDDTMLFTKLKENVALLGNLAQWVSAAGSLFTVGIALYGVGKAVPYFENLNLREANAQLQISMRNLEAEKSKASAELDGIRAGLAERQKYAASLEVGIVCLLANEDMNGFLNAIADRSTALEPYLSRDRSLPIPKEIETDTVVVRAVRDQILQSDVDRLSEEARKPLVEAWAKVDEKFASKLSDIILPAANAIVRPTRDELEAAARNRLGVAKELVGALLQACAEVEKSIEPPK